MKSDEIEPARDSFSDKAGALKQELMKLLSIAAEAADFKDGEIAEAAIRICSDVFELSLDISNETERDMHAVCDLLAISLAATCAEKSDELFSGKEMAGRDIAYLSKAFAAAGLKGKRQRL
ncbi:MAG: hypothetical protein LBU32_09710 [Clostridiales bacterium]|nr:hypothetical protein [Clostridiales bacterium]